MNWFVESFRSVLDVLSEEKWFTFYGFGSCGLALIVAKYGAGFSWRQVLVGLLAVGIWSAGTAFLRSANKPPKFHRTQFRIGLTDLGQAFLDAGICTEDDVKQHQRALYDSLGTFSNGYITFTWLQSDLFFMNDSSRFSEFAELTINIKPLGDRALTVGPPHCLPDCIELRNREAAYELVLIKSENRRGWIDPEGPVVTLMTIPYEFLRALQTPLRGFKEISDYKQQREALERAGLEYWQDGEVPSAWDYKGEYAELHWWEF